MDISADQVRVALLSLIAFIVSVSVHEYGHALVADKLGDRVPRLQGRSDAVAGRAHRSAGDDPAAADRGADARVSADRVGEAGADEPGELHPQVQHADRQHAGVGGGPGDEPAAGDPGLDRVRGAGEGGRPDGTGGAGAGPVRPGGEPGADVLQPDSARAARRGGRAGRDPPRIGPTVSRRRCGATGWGSCSCCCSPAR